MNELIFLLGAIHHLSPFLVEFLQEHLKEQAFPKKSFLLKAGQTSQNIHFISQGLVRCYYLKYETEVCSWFMKEKDVIVSVESFFKQTESKESIQALEDTITYSISFNELEYAYANFPEFNYVGRILLQKYYTLSEERIYSLRMQRSHERYAYLIEHHPELILRVPSKYIASYLGITEETLSRIRSKGF